MSYMALYRKWRPDTFPEVKGQEHIVTTLRNQITHDRIGHAYLFCGTRGTGKTTVAKLFAKAVNCEEPGADGSPCGACRSCQAIAKGNSMNVIEIDAASNNGVDNIREIRDEVQYAPTEGKYKVYIIDEVHMLSIGAFNALLKTLEEPPSYVIFILATTESHKIPITILSRCQKYDFHRISIETITDRLEELLKREEIPFEDKAIRFVAKAADGSMRDGLSLLDQCIAQHLGQELTYDRVLEVLGAVDIETFDEMLGYIEKQEVPKVIDLIDKLLWQGRDLNQFVSDFTWYFRNLLLIAGDEGGIDMVDASAEHRRIMLARAKDIPLERLMRYIRVLSEVNTDMRYASQKRVVLELAMFKLCKPQMETDITSLLERVRQLEDKVEQGIPVMMAAEKQPAQQEVQTEAASPAEDFDFDAAAARELPPARREQIQKLVDDWGAVLKKVGNPIIQYLDSAAVFIGEEEDTLVLSYPAQDDMKYRMMTSSDENMNRLTDAISEMTGSKVRILTRVGSSKAEKSNLYNYDLMRKINGTIEFED